MLVMSLTCPTLCQRRPLQEVFSLLEGEEWACVQDLSRRIILSVSNVSAWPFLPLFFSCGIFVIRELRAHGRKPSYEFRRRMASLLCFVHRIVAFVESLFDVFKVGVSFSFSSLRLAWHC